jgi:DNA topoisomerase-1
VKFGKINATLPRDKDPESLTMEDALALLAEREAKSPAKGKAATKKAAPKKKAPARKQAKKTASKKPKAA